MIARERYELLGRIEEGAEFRVDPLGMCPGLRVRVNP